MMAHHSQRLRALGWGVRIEDESPLTMCIRGHCGATMCMFPRQLYTQTQKRVVFGCHAFDGGWNYEFVCYVAWCLS